MASTIIMPQLGETVAEGKILAWFKSVGDEIKEGDNLFEVETDKVTIEVQAIVAGRLSEIRVQFWGNRQGRRSAQDSSRRWGGEGPAGAEAPVTKASPWRSPFDEVSTPTDRFGSAKGPNGVSITPLARRLIAQHGLDLAVLAAEAERRGQEDRRGGRARSDFGASAMPTLSPAPVAPPPTRSPPPVQDGDVIELNTVRQKTAERLAENWRTIPHVFQAIEVDFTGVERARKNSQGGDPKGARLVPDVPAVHCTGDRPGDLRLSPDQCALRRPGAEGVARRRSRHRGRSRSQRSRRASRARGGRTRLDRAHQGDAPADGQAKAASFLLTTSRRRLLDQRQRRAREGVTTPMIEAPQVGISTSPRSASRPQSCRRTRAISSRRG